MKKTLCKLFILSGLILYLPLNSADQVANLENDTDCNINENSVEESKDKIIQLSFFNKTLQSFKKSTAPYREKASAIAKKYSKQLKITAAVGGTLAVIAVPGVIYKKKINTRLAAEAERQRLEAEEIERKRLENEMHTAGKNLYNSMKARHKAKIEEKRKKLKVIFETGKTAGRNELLKEQRLEREEQARKNEEARIALLRETTKNKFANEIGIKGGSFIPTLEALMEIVGNPYSNELKSKDAKDARIQLEVADELIKKACGNDKITVNEYIAGYKKWLYELDPNLSSNPSQVHVAKESRIVSDIMENYAKTVGAERVAEQPELEQQEESQDQPEQPQDPQDQSQPQKSDDLIEFYNN